MNHAEDDGFEYNKQAIKNMSEERDRLFVSQKQLKDCLAEALTINLSNTNVRREWLLKIRKLIK